MMRCWSRSMMVALAGVAAVGAAWGADVALARGGKPLFAIVAAEDATPTERTAANELKKHLDLIAGAPFALAAAPVAGLPSIHVGATASVRALAPGVDWDALGMEGVVLRRAGDDLVLAGGRPRGTLYAVYDFLETLGCRWYAVDMEPVIPRAPDLAVAWTDRVYVPPLEYRQDFTAALADPVWAVRFRNNGRQWMKAIPPEWGGTAYFGEGHTLTRHLLPPAKYFDEHPEWFAFRKDTGERGQTQPCLTHPDAQAEIVKNALAYLADQYPTWGDSPKNLGIGYEDNDKLCQCETCEAAYARTGAPSGPLFELANVLGEAIAGPYPDTVVRVLAYWITDRPPNNLAMRDNVAAILGVLDRNHKTPIGSVGHFARYLKTYAATGAKPYIWDYDPHFADFIQPHPNHFVFADSMKFYHEQGVTGVFLQGGWGNGGEFMHLRAYINSRAMWDPSVDARALAKEFCDAYYGAAAPYMLDYLALIDRAVRREPSLWLGVYNGTTEHFLALDDLNEATQIFRAAEEATRDDADRNFRVRRARLSVDVVWIARHHKLREEATRDGKLFLGPVDPHAALDEIEKNEFKIDTYREWADFGAYMKKLRGLLGDRPANASVDVAPGEGLALGAERLLAEPKGAGEVVADPAAAGGRALRLAAGDPAREARLVLPASLAGRWRVGVRLRAEPSDAGVAVGIYAPNEYARDVLPARDLAAYRTVDLGVHDLAPDARIWVQPNGAGTWDDAGDVWIDSIILTRR